MPFSLPALPWKWIGVALAFVAVIAVIVVSVKSYGDARYDAGVADTDAAWKAAAAKLEAESRASAEAADKNAATREEQWADRVEQEKERINEAVAAGSDPLDVLFPSGRVPD